MTGKRKRKLAMPDTLIIVASVVLLVAILSWIIPSGTYDYQEMNINGRIRNVAIDGTYHTIDKSEVTTTGFLGFFSVLYRGCVEAVFSRWNLLFVTAGFPFKALDSIFSFQKITVKSSIQAVPLKPFLFSFFERNPRVFSAFI